MGHVVDAEFVPAYRAAFLELAGERGRFEVTQRDWAVMNDAEGGEERMGRWQKAEKVAIRVTPMGMVKKSD